MGVGHVHAVQGGARGVEKRWRGDHGWREGRIKYEDYVVGRRACIRRVKDECGGDWGDDADCDGGRHGRKQIQREAESGLDGCRGGGVGV